MKDLIVHVSYQNADGKIIQDREYTLKHYTEILREDLLRLISSVEDLVYKSNHNLPKEDWSDDVWNAFLGVKHKLLDKANDVGRIPESIVDKDADLYG